MDIQPATPHRVFSTVLALLWLSTVRPSGLALAAEPPAPPAGVSPAASGPRVLVVVEGESLTEAMAKLQLRRRLPPNLQVQSPQFDLVFENFKTQLIEEYIGYVLLRNEARRQGTEVAEEEVAAMVDTLKAAVPADRTFEQELADHQTTVEQLQDDLRDSLCIVRLIDRQVGTDFAASETEIAQFYELHAGRFSTPEAVHVRHLLIKVDKDSPPAAIAKARKKADELRQQLLDGADFGDIARQHSDCQTRNNGGDLGLVGRDDLVPEFEKAAFSQSPYEIGNLVESPFGFHVVQVLERRPAVTQALAEVRDDVARQVATAKKNRAVADYVATLRTGAAIVYPPAGGANGK